MKHTVLKFPVFNWKVTTSVYAFIPTPAWVHNSVDQCSLSPYQWYQKKPRKPYFWYHAAVSMVFFDRIFGIADTPQTLTRKGLADTPYMFHSIVNSIITLYWMPLKMWITPNFPHYQDRINAPSCLAKLDTAKIKTVIKKCAGRCRPTSDPAKQTSLTKRLTPV